MPGLGGTKQVWAYECNMDQELADAVAYAPGRRCMCTHQMARTALFSVK